MNYTPVASNIKVIAWANFFFCQINILLTSSCKRGPPECHPLSSHCINSLHRDRSEAKRARERRDETLKGKMVNIKYSTQNWNCKANTQRRSGCLPYMPEFFYFRSFLSRCKKI